MERSAERAAGEATAVPPEVLKALRREQGVFWITLAVAVLASGSLWRGVEAMARGTVSALTWVRIAALTPVVVLSLLVCGRILTRQSALRGMVMGSGRQAIATLRKG